MTPLHTSPAVTAGPAIEPSPREQLSAQAECLERIADHVDQLDQVERPRVARRLVRRLRSCADRIYAAIDPPAACDEFDEPLLRLEGEAVMLQQESSAFLVRDGMHRTLAPDLFHEVSDAAVLVGELAKAGMGAYIAGLRSTFSGRRRLHLDPNPLHVFGPVIAAGHVWAREHVTACDVDRHELVQALSDGILAVLDGTCPPNVMVCPTTQMTVDALDRFSSHWAQRASGSLATEIDAACSLAIAPHDGCGIPDELLAAWFVLGTASGILTLRLGSAGAPELDTADATRLLLALDPHRYDQPPGTPTPRETDVTR